MFGRGFKEDRSEAVTTPDWSFGVGSMLRGDWSPKAQRQFRMPSQCSTASMLEHHEN